MSTLQKKESGCKFGNKNKCVLMHRQVEDQPSKKPKKDNDKSAVAMLKDARHLGYVFQDTEPPESSSIFAEEPNSTNAFLKNHTASRKHPRKQRSIAWSDSNQKSSSGQSVRSKI